ncbi:MAG: aminotransferase class I/II-fold pyridoxal phosphate-dependent enzyme [Phycisphaerales bacterium]|nr:aminotransferase class I/II-fold pyridoxal phosphate-dependent enzyme [Phycisphaerales bacterium]
MATSSAVSHALRPFGTTIFSRMTELARQHGAINLGQGFPDFDGPESICVAAAEAMRAGHNQYAPMGGVPQLQEAIARDAAEGLGRTIDPAGEVTVTSGCTEAIAATMAGLLNPGDEVIAFEPFYDSYPATVAMCGATLKTVTLRPPTFAFDAARLEVAVTDRTRAVLLNTPHNPTGRVATANELEAIADVCRRHDLIAITDEVYDRLVLEGEQQHLCLAACDGMVDRTITLRSLGKTFSLTGWKIGWAIAPAHLTAAIRSAHQFLTYAVPTPLQHAAAHALSLGEPYYRTLRDEYRQRRDVLLQGLSQTPLRVFEPEGTYFVMCDHASLGHGDDLAFCRWLVETVGVAAIPPSSFYADPRSGADLVRFAFCKSLPVLEAASKRLAGLRAP